MGRVTRVTALTYIVHLWIYKESDVWFTSAKYIHIYTKNSLALYDWFDTHTHTHKDTKKRGGGRKGPIYAWLVLPWQSSVISRWKPFVHKGEILTEKNKRLAAIHIHTCKSSIHKVRNERIQTGPYIIFCHEKALRMIIDRHVRISSVYSSVTHTPIRCYLILLFFFFSFQTFGFGSNVKTHLFQMKLDIWWPFAWYTRKYPAGLQPKCSNYLLLLYLFIKEGARSKKIKGLCRLVDDHITPFWPHLKYNRYRHGV